MGHPVWNLNLNPWILRFIWSQRNCCVAADKNGSAGIPESFVCLNVIIVWRPRRTEPGGDQMLKWFYRFSCTFNMWTNRRKFDICFPLSTNLFLFVMFQKPTFWKILQAYDIEKFTINVTDIFWITSMYVHKELHNIFCN